MGNTQRALIVAITWGYGFVILGTIIFHSQTIGAISGIIGIILGFIGWMKYDK